jgi:hypothetical protein
MSNLRLWTAVVLLVMTFSAPGADAADLGAATGEETSVSQGGSEQEQRLRQGRGMVIAGLTVQGIGLALVAASRADLNLYTYGRPIWHGVSIPFAPITVDGFHRLLGDGTRAGDLRALSIGFFEGAAYSGLVAIIDLVIELALLQQRDESDDDDYGMGPGPALALIPAISIVAHASVAVGLLIPGIVAAAQSRGSAPPVTDGGLAIVPWVAGDGAGFAACGRF